MSAEELPKLLGGVLRELVNIDDLRLFTDSLENAVFYRDEPIILGTGMSKLLDSYNELENVLAPAIVCAPVNLTTWSSKV